MSAGPRKVLSTQWRRLLLVLASASVLAAEARSDEPDPPTATIAPAGPDRAVVVVGNDGSVSLGTDGPYIVNRIGIGPSDPFFVYFHKNAEDEALGVALAPPEPALRAQLGLKEGEGLLVTEVKDQGPASSLGLQTNDLLLGLGGESLGSPGDLTGVLGKAGDKTMELRLIRAGKTITVRVRPTYHFSWAPVDQDRRRFYIGVPVQPVDEAVRAHLKDLPEGQGLLATGVEPDSPAAKAGLKPFDVLLELGGTRLTDVDTLVSRIEASQGRPTPLVIVRAGKTVSLSVTPVPRKEEQEAKERNLRETQRRELVKARLYQPMTPIRLRHLTTAVAAGGRASQPPSPPDGGLKQMAEELDRLRKAIEALEKRLDPSARDSTERK